LANISSFDQKVEMKHEEMTYKIIACAMDVYKKLGPGYPEYIYHRALIIEFKL